MRGTKEEKEEDEEERTYRKNRSLDGLCRVGNGV